MSSGNFQRASRARAKGQTGRHVPLVCAITLILLPFTAAAQTPGDIETFYPGVEALTRSPPEESLLKTVCQKRVAQRYVTFIGVQPKRALIAAVTHHRLKRPDRTIWLKWRLVRRGSRGSSSEEGTMDWAYIFDRNGDGRVDYFAYLDGPNPVAPKGHTGTLPGPEMTGTEFKFYMANMKMTFWHLADDNFDGRGDGMFIRLRDLKSQWMDAWLIIRDRNFDGTFEDCQWYEEGPNSKIAKACGHSGNRYSAPGKKLSGLNSVPLPDDWPILQWINEGANQCRLGPGSLYAKPEEVPGRGE